MKIAIIIDSLGKGGAERQALLAARELARRGCEVELIRYYQVPDEYDPATCAPARNVLLLKSGKPIRFTWALTQHLRRGGFDVVHTIKESASLYGCLAGRLAGVPVRFASQRVDVKECKAVGTLRAVNRLATAWIPNSRGVQESLVDMLGVERDRIHVVCNGVETANWRSALSPSEARARLGLPANAPTVAMIAALRPEKNHAMFIRMADEVHHSNPEARFLIVGDARRSDDGAQARLEEMAKTLGIERRIHFLGQRADLADVLAAIDVSVLTSESEGLSNAMLESMASGKAVVTTDSCGAGDLVTDGVDGYITPRGDATAMAACVSRLLADEALRMQLGESARRTIAERFSVEAMADSIVAVYRKYLPAGKI